MSDLENPEESQDNQASPEETLDQPKSRKLFRVMGYFFIGLAVLVAVYGTVAYLAWQRGESLRSEEVKEALEEEFAKQIDFAEEDITAGNLELALRRLEWILDRDPDFGRALVLQADVRERLSLDASPEPFPTATRVATVEIIKTNNSEPEAAFGNLEKVMASQDWQEAVSAIVAFQSQYPDYRRLDTDAMLYDSYLNLGQELIMGDQVELGLFNLSQAEKLGDLPVEAEDQRTWAELYLLGISYYGVDWETAVYYFRDLCAAAPYYQNACVKLQEALVAYGDQFAGNLDWCPAREVYLEAYRLSNDQATSQKLGDARDACSEATPTPSVPISGTLTIEND